MKKKKLISILLTPTLCLTTLTACVANASTTDTTSTAATSTAAQVASIAANVTYDEDDYYFDWQSNSYQTINLGSDTVTINKSGIYQITGTLTDGSLVVDIDKDTDAGTVYLVLDNANITSTTSAPIYIKDAKKAVLILENGTTNTISQGSNCTVDDDNQPSAAIFAKSDLTITGSGTLNVTTEFNDGITSKDILKITDGTLNIQAEGDGMVGKDVLAIQKGNITITAGKDGIRSTNDSDSSLGNILIADGTLKITSDSDAIKAKGTVEIDGGSFDLTAGGGYAQNTESHMDNALQGKPGGGFNQPPQDATAPSEASATAPSEASATAPPTASSTASATEPPTAPSTASATEPPTAPSTTSATAPPTAPSTTSATAPAATSTTASATETETEKINGVCADRDVIITAGTLTVSAYDDAVNANGAVLIEDGTFTLQSGSKGIHSDSNVTIDNGSITIKNSFEGIEGVNITVNNGDISIVSSDDGFNVNDFSGLATINGGTISINAGGDGLDSNGSIKMTAGTVSISGPTSNNNGALDYDGTFLISGGTLVAAGSSGMAETTSTDSSQPSILMYYSSTQAAGTVVTLKDSSGNTVASYTPDKEYASVVIASPAMETGQSYALYSGSTKVVTFTLTDKVTYLNESGITEKRGMDQGGGGHGNRQQP